MLFKKYKSLIINFKCWDFNKKLFILINSSKNLLNAQISISIVE